MKLLVVICLICINSYAKEVQLDIKADSFLSNPTKNIIEFKGNVSMIKGKNTIKANDVTVYTKLDKKTNKTIAKKYVAVGNVKFTIIQKESLLIGNGEKVIYDIDKDIYEIIGNGYLEDTVSKRVLTGEKMFINNKIGTIRIAGKKNKPVTFKLMMSGK